MSSDFPFGEIMEIDPYPFHGLVYRNDGSSVNMLAPTGGRPHIVLPPQILPVPAEMHSYFPAADGMLWDIGRPDPPVTPAIEAAGGLSQGKRIMEGETLPARLGERTYQVNVGAFVGGGGITLVWSRPGRPGTTEIAAYTLTDFGLDWNNLAEESSGQRLVDVVPGLTPSLNASVMDSTPDGTRRLIGIRQAGREIAGAFSGRGWDSFLVGIVEVTLTLDEEGAIQAAAEIVASGPSLMGSFVRSVSQDVKSLASFNSGYPLCQISYSPVEDPLATSGNHGFTSVDRHRTGRVLGALYGSGGLEYFTLEQQQTDLHEADMSRPSYSPGFPVDPGGGGTPYCQPYVPGVPSPPASQTYHRLLTHRTAIRFGGETLSATITLETSAAMSGWGGDPPTPITGTISTTCRSSTGGEVIRSSGQDSFFYLDKIGTTPDPGYVFVPAPVLQRNNEYVIAPVQRRGWRSLLVVSGYSSPGTNPGWYLGMLTPGGVKGDTVAYPVRSVIGPAFIYGGAYNPMTGQYARDCDMPGRTVIGWL